MKFVINCHQTQHKNVDHTELKKYMNKLRKGVSESNKMRMSLFSSKRVVVTLN